MYVCGCVSEGKEDCTEDLSSSILRVNPQHLCICAQSCPTPSDPMDCRLPVSSVHGIFQARIPEWVVIPASSGSS